MARQADMVEMEEFVAYEIYRGIRVVERQCEIVMIDKSQVEN
jgi:hypothetical protein